MTSKPPKTAVSFDVYEDQLATLDAAMATFRIRNRGKALRALLDYATSLNEEGKAEVFGTKRCLHCPPRPSE